MDAAMTNRHRFWDRMAAHYSRQPIADEAAYQEKLRITRSYLRPDMELVEFGCGTGGTAIAHAPFVRHIRAIDFSAAMLDIARDKARATGIGNIAFERADIGTLAVADNAIDMVLGLSILHLLPNRDAVLAKVHRMLRPGGLFVSSTTCIGDTMPLMKLVAPLGRAVGLLPSLNVMTVAELTAAQSAAGFVIEQQWQPAPNKAVFIVARKPA